MPKFLVKHGIDYPPSNRAEVGDIVEDIPPKAIKWLREQGIIELVDGKEDLVTEVVTEEVVADEVVTEEIEEI